MKPRLFEAEAYTNRRLWEVLPDLAWQGKPCFIVGGGPSLEGFDWELLRGRRTIGINRAFERFDPTIVFSMDLRYLMWILGERYGPEALEKFQQTPGYKVWLTTYVSSLPADIFIVPVYKNYELGRAAFTGHMAEGLGHGNLSGYGALNLAACLGASPIYLLGFDMNHRPIQDEALRPKHIPAGFEVPLGPNKVTHWHGGHPMPQEEHNIANSIADFNRAARILGQRKIKVVNLNPDSALECFEKKDPERILQREVA